MGKSTGVMERIKRLRKRTRILITALTIALPLLLGLFLYNSNEFQTHYLGVMKILNRPDVKEYMLTELDGTNNLTDILLNWEQKRLTWRTVPSQGILILKASWNKV
jgi:hypothetical protein